MIARIIFYNANPKPGVLAEFRVVLAAPWGEHACDGVICHKVRDEHSVICVRWPNSSPRGAVGSSRRWHTSPMGRDAGEAAERMILDAWRRFQAGERGIVIQRIPTGEELDRLLGSEPRTAVQKAHTLAHNLGSLRIDAAMRGRP